MAMLKYLLVLAFTQFGKKFCVIHSIWQRLFAASLVVAVAVAVGGVGVINP